jgi:hypothetical protein
MYRGSRRLQRWHFAVSQLIAQGANTYVVAADPSVVEPWPPALARGAAATVIVRPIRPVFVFADVAVQDVDALVVIGTREICSPDHPLPVRVHVPHHGGWSLAAGHDSDSKGPQTTAASLDASRFAACRVDARAVGSRPREGSDCAA